MSDSPETNGATKVKFLGATKQVGRSGFAVKNGNTQILLDYGVLISREEPGFPVHVPPNDVDAIILTHAHLDHSGAIPLFHIKGKVPVYATGLTLELAEILVKDFINLAGYHLPYEYLDLDSMLQCRKNVEYGDEVQIGGLHLRFLNAGHIPGSMQVVLNAGNGKSLVYTGDINLIDTQLLQKGSVDYGEPGAIIAEATYANDDHPNRQEMEQDFVKRLTEVVERGGTALVPAFSVGRSQEILCTLAAHDFPYPVLMDGMALKVNEVMLQYPRFFRDYDLLQRSLERAKWITNWNERKIATTSPGVIVSPAGMLKGGTAAYYVQKVADRPKNAIFMVSFQIPGTPGKTLIEQRKIFMKGKPRSVEAEVHRFEFSSHAGKAELQQMAKNLRGSPKVYVVHGSEKSCVDMAEWVNKEIGLTAVAPSAGDIFKL